VQTANSWEITFTTLDRWAPLWQRQIAPYLVSKGSIAVNGISLTVADCDPDSSWFKVAVIPHSYEQTNLKYLVPGSWVNLESDILAKYVGQFISSGLGSLMARSVQGSTSSASLETLSNLNDITPDFLAEHGFL
jgi:riboflavin synthase